MWTPKFHSLSKFQLYIRAFSTKITMFHIRSWDLIHLTAESLLPLPASPYFLYLQALSNDHSIIYFHYLFLWVCLFIFVDYTSKRYHAVFIFSSLLISLKECYHLYVEVPVFHKRFFWQITDFYHHVAAPEMQSIHTKLNEARGIGYRPYAHIFW